MKRINLLIIIALISTAAIKAQQPNRPTFDPKERAVQTVNELAKQITITPAIQDSLKTTFINFFTEMRKARESGSRHDMQKMESVRDLNVKKFLTDEQFKAYQKFMEEKRTRRNRPEGGGGMPERP
ncbi:MAG TPA: hypothetical protein DIW31_10415 [Bacteroidales bacterium]|nr:hypothetical protein [Bacteroidales bacterium]